MLLYAIKKWCKVGRAHTDVLHGGPARRRALRTRRARAHTAAAGRVGGAKVTAPRGGYCLLAAVAADSPGLDRRLDRRRPAAGPSPR
jgi:hypothetical protein